MTPTTAPISWTMFAPSPYLAKADWLSFINRAVNNAIDFDPRPPATADAWRIGPVVGQCHDYAVTKRELLLHLGYHAGELLLCEVELPNREHHLVLIVNGMVLDNLDKRVLPLAKMRYKILRMQSQQDPNHWEMP